jgi:putative endopeptidase
LRPGRQGIFDPHIIAHEMSHTFDTERSAFDPAGRIRNWWKPADLAHFNAAAAGLAAQYDTYKPFPEFAVNGKQTLDENIADFGGTCAACDAYRQFFSASHNPGHRSRLRLLSGSK